MNFTVRLDIFFQNRFELSLTDDNLLHFPEELSLVIIIYRFLSLKLVVISEDLLNLHKLIGKPLNQI